MISNAANHLSDWLIGLSPRKQLLLSLFLGGTSALAFVPVSAVVLLFPALSGLLWLIHHAGSVRRGFLLGWAFGLGHFLVGLYWIGYAFFVYPDKHAFLAVPGVLGLAAIMAIFLGIVGGAYRWMGPRLIGNQLLGARHALLFAVIWIIVEWLRSWIFTGFPWNLIGSVWVSSNAMLQIAAYGGVYILSLITVFVCTLPVLLCSKQPRALLKMTAGIALLALVWGGGVWRLSGEGAEITYVEGVVLRLVQPNIPQRLKWQPDLRGSHVSKLVGLSRLPAKNNLVPTHVIWPETSVPYSVPGNQSLLDYIASAAPQGSVILGGSLRRETSDKNIGAENNDNNSGNRPAVWNALFVVGSDGTLHQGYDKSHLVPFGEYVPLQDYLPLEKLTDGAVGFTNGPGIQTLQVQGLPALSPLICYEIIFSGNVVDGDNRPGWILNITNDAWYGYSAGPFQHFAAARMRAVEEGLPVVRVANTGISGVIDGYGRVQSILDLEKEGILDAPLPSALGKTLYARFGPRIPMIICASILLCFMVLWVVNNLAGIRKE